MPLKILTLNNRKCRGFSLLEAMIGFFILSVGMLGIASLQGLSLQAGKTSVYGSVAAMKVEELLESMRANPGSLATYAGTDNAGADNSCVGTANCSSAQMAAEDVFWWNKNLTAGLPSTVTTVVTVTAETPPSKLARVKIELSWQERDDMTAGASVTNTYTVTSNICTDNPC
jgi:type IV pilus assembly protein PilV